MNKSSRTFQTLVLAIAIAVSANGAEQRARDFPLATADVTGSKDSALLGRFSESFILSYAQAQFDAYTLPLGPLVAVPNQMDARNNRVVTAEQSKVVEGRRTHWLYLLPPGVTPVAAVRNYQNAVTGKGGSTLFECAGEKCGGGTNLPGNGGGKQSMAMHLWPSDRIVEQRNSAEHCLYAGRLANVHYAALAIAKPVAHAAVLAFQFVPAARCDAYEGRTLVMVELVETQSMAQTMEVPKADEMGQAINKTGRIALYGILFDSGKAEVKPESKETLVQISQLLTTNKTLKLLVVGHTDNVGSFASNLDLSKRRAEAVIAVLTTQYKIDGKRLQPFGVAHASPIEANTADEGRAKNRRVELVGNN